MKHRLVLIGCGTVGQGLLEILHERGEELERVYGASFPLVGVCDMRMGSALDPDNDWAARNQLTELSLLSLSVAPTAAVRLCDWLSIGGGIAVTYGKLDLKVRLPLQRLGEPPLKLDGMDDLAVAPVASILIEPNNKIRIGVVYQGETDLHLEGKGKLKGEKADLSLKLPLAQAVRTSLFYNPWQPIVLLASAGWEDWSTAESLPLSAPGGSISIPIGFRDTWYVAGGFHVKLNEKWGVQTGFRYDSSALKDSDRTTTLPIDRVLTTSAGASYEYSDSLRLTFSFTWLDLGDSKVNTPGLVKGDYRNNDLFVFALSLGWKKLPWSGWGTL